jgi:hypothetical protein
MVWECSTNGRKMRNAHKLLVGKSVGKKPRGRPMSSWDDNIKMDFTETGWRRCGLDASG